MNSPLKFTDLLDARECPANSIENSVWIPFSELPNRIYEMPKRGSHVRVVEDADSSKVVTWLVANGWLAEATSCSFGASPQHCALWSPNSFLWEMRDRTTECGPVIDLGCGVGRDAIFLASCGHLVTAIDHLPDAIERAQKLESRYDFSRKVDWKTSDTMSAIKAFGPSAGLVLLHFHYHPEFLSALAAKLTSEAKVSIEGFSETHFARFGKPGFSNIVSDPTSLPPEFKVLHHDANWRDERHTRRLLLQRR